MKVIGLVVMLGWLLSNTAYGEETVYSDRDLMVATQIAYYDITEDQLEKCGGSGTVRELLNAGTTHRELQSKVNHAEEEGVELKKRMAEKDLALYEEIVSIGSKYGDWRVVDVRNTNQETGFYSVLLETDPEHAIIGFRGSESSDYNQVLKDWINADFGLLMARIRSSSRMQPIIWQISIEDMPIPTMLRPVIPWEEIWLSMRRLPHRMTCAAS